VPVGVEEVAEAHAQADSMLEDVEAVLEGDKTEV
jgi:hypothetical protein